ncbi:BspA family leucine-rich repeat surface protein [Croceitalea sp. P059]|uniref:BspA family leucine-rich repeat surface protein n=1 Tax=Croceitalea sp. P059 TaxID=3075601 RepID=UPI002888094C|nr:BspA family leucine-rich repeat surface protein [Croceitalea sp. P059]MDT0540920.1 BspA family leucine-rich repeat surface protein [Croceitalea sp. P059]
MKKFTLTILIFLFGFLGTAQWQQFNNPQGGSVSDILSVESRLFIATNGGVFKSENNGSNWTLVNNGFPKNAFIWTIVTDGTNLFASVDQNGIYKSTNNGSSWFPINTGIESETFYQIYAENNNIIAAYANGGITFSNDGGLTWSEGTGPINNTQFSSFTSFNNKIYGGGSALFESSDNGVSWQEIIIPGLGPNGIRSLHANENKIYAGDDDDIFVFTTDTDVWSKIELNTFATITSIVEFDSQIYLVAANRIYVSDNDFQTFTVLSNPFVELSQNDIYINEDVILTVGIKGVFKTDDAGLNWYASNDGLVALNVEALLVDNNDIYLGTSFIGFYFSDDAGLTWELRNNGLNNFSARSISQLLLVNDVLYSITQDGIYSSANKGENWIKRLSPPGVYSISNISYDNGIFSSVTYGNEVYLSSDNMESWTTKPIVGLDFETSFNRIVLNENKLVLSTVNNELFISEDLGDTWANITIPNSFAATLDIDFINQKLVVATSRGVFITDDLGSTWSRLNGLEIRFNEIEVVNEIIYGATSDGLYATRLDLTGWYPVNENLERELTELELNSTTIFGGSFRQGLWNLGRDLVNLPEQNLNPFITTWKTDNEGISEDNQITIPIYEANQFAVPLYYNYNVDWGDGTTSEGLTTSVTHTYAVAGTYTVAITGSFPRIYFGDFNTETDKQKILSIEQWGDMAWSSMSRAFYNCSNLDVKALDTPNLSNSTYLSQMFEGCSSLVGNELFSNWDLNNVTSTDGMFNGASQFNQAIGSWDISNVRYMSAMFYKAAAFNQDISLWDVSSVEYLSLTFSQSSFNQPIGSWDVSNVVGFESMFAFNTAFNQDISSWNSENARGMQNMFLQADSFNQNISSWNVANVQDMNGMFSGASSFNQNLGSWDISRVTEMGNMFNSSGLSQENYDNILIGWNALISKRFDVNLGAFGISYCEGGTARQNLVEIYNWNFSDGGLQINCEANQQRPFVTSWLVKDINPFNNSITIPTDSNLTYDFEVDWGDGTFDSNVDGDISHSYAEEGLYQVSITGDFPRIIFALGGINSESIQSINQWGDIKWTSMEGAFADCNNLDVVAQDKPNLSGVTSTREMFSNCRKLVGNQSFNNWDVSTIVDMDFMFKNTLLFNTNLSNWDVSSVNSMYQMFYESAFNQSLGSWNVSLVAQMDDMFLNSGLSTLNYDNTLVEWSRLPLLQSNLVFDAGTSTFCLGEDARQVLIDNYNWTINDFGLDCSDVQAFVTTWKTDNLGKTNDNQISIPISGGPYTIDWGDGTIETEIYNESLHTYDLKGVYTVSITGEYNSIRVNSFTGNEANSDALKLLKVNQWGDNQWLYMSFSGCENLDVLAIDSPDLSQITSLFSMFSGCKSLQGNDSFNNWDLSTVTDLTQVFNQCENFNANISNWDVSNVTNMSNLFGNCLEFNADISNWDVSKVTMMGGMFSGAMNFNQPLNNWDVSQVTNMRGMFQSIGFNQDIGNWDVSQVTDMSFMFGNSTAFNQDISSWDVSSVVDMYYMFGFSQFNEDLSNWNISSVTDMTKIFLNSRLSNENYDRTLISWSKLPTLQNDVQLGAQQNQYCQSENARQNLIDNYNWVFNDNGKQEGCVITCTEFNLALNKPTQQSSTYGNGVSDLAVDGNTIGQSPWAPEASLQHSTTELQPWWQVDLGETSAIKGITIFNRTDKLLARLNNFYILISETPYNETATLSELLVDDTILNYFFEGEAGLEENFDFDANGRYVRIQLSGTGTLHMAEVEVLGCAVEAVQRPFVTTWKTDNMGLLEDNQVTIPTFPGETYNYTVDWGDGTTTENVTGDITHTYSSSGTYTVSISGDFTRIYLSSSISNAQKLLTIEQWGDIVWSSMEEAFYASDPNITASDVPNLTNVTSLKSMFYACPGLRNENLSMNNWDVSGIEDMASMFTLSGISGIKIPDWDVGNVKDMSSMFVFGSITFDINQWDVSSVIDMSNMFFDCSIGQSLENWDVSSVIDMSNIFGDPSMTNDDYDKTLIGWSQLPSLQSGVQLDAPSKQYCLSEEARQSIIDIYGWTINDGGKAVDCEETECTSFTNIALNKIATQSSTYGDGVASIAIDGNTFGDSPWTADATLQHTISGEFQSWWQVDLGEISTIKGLNIFNRTDKLQGRLNNFYILISETPFSETATLSELLTDGTIFNYFFEGEAGLEENFDFETNGRYVRVQLSGIGTLHLAEVEVMGCAGELTQRPFVTTWKTDNPGESEDNQISIPTFDGETYDYFVDWGDGTTSENVTADITHSYAVPGSYTVSISGEFPRIYFNYYGDSNKLLSVDEWGSIKWSSMEDAFSGARNLDVIAEDVPDLSQVITTRNMFANCRNLKGTISFDNWDVSNIENMDSMFVWALLFNQQLSEWDVSNVKNMNYMFGFNLEFNGDISNWNTPNVEIMAGMFDTANSFNQDIGNWNVSKVKDMSYMFLSSETFNQNISGWDVSNVTKMTETFQSAPLFDQDLSSWRVLNVTDMSRMFQSSGLSNENYDKTLIGWSLLLSLQNGVQLDAPSNQYCSSQEARQSIIDNYGWTINDGGKAIGCEETECTSFTNIALNKMATQSSTYGDGVASIAVDGNTFGDSPWTASATLQHTVSGEFQPWWQVDLGETSSIKGITIFNRSDKLQARLNNFYILISETPFSETATLSELLVDDNILNYFFEGEAGLEDNVDFDTNGRYVRIQLSETGTLHMAEVEVLGCAGEAVPRPFVTTWKTDNPGISDDNQITIPTFPGETYNYTVDWGDGTTTENVTGDIIHSYSASGTYVVSISGDFPRIYFNDAFDVSINDSDKIIAVNSWGNNEWSSMQVAFSGCENLNVIADDVPNLSIANSTAAMFLGCSNLVGNLKFNEWNMSNIEEMQSMFNRAILFNQPLNNWNTEKALNINGMFAYAASFNQSINSWNIENVENIGVMFGFASSFNQSLQDWDTSSVTNMNGVFAEALTFNQSLENWDVSKVEDMSGILDLSGLSIENYDATLIGWSQLGSLQNDVVLGAFEKEYCLSEFARQNIIDNFGWIFNDGGKAVDCNPGGCLKPGNLAFGKPTEQSTTYGNGLSLYAVDGNIVGESPWSADLQHTISGESQSWWQVDLEGNFSIENIVIFNRSDKLQSRLNNFYVLISETPFSPTATLDELLTDENIEHIFFEGAAGLESEIAFETTGRYVRVQLSDVGTLHMAEVQVFGCSLAVPLTANLNEMNLYPNPANDYINVSFSEVAKVDVFYVYDISGRMIQSSKANANENNYLLNVTQLTTGTYFVKAIDNQGIEYYKQMVIKR